MLRFRSGREPESVQTTKQSEQFNLYSLIAYVVDDNGRLFRFLAVLSAMGALGALVGFRVWL
jgi:hypothetical protein